MVFQVSRKYDVQLLRLDTLAVPAATKGTDSASPFRNSPMDLERSSNSFRHPLKICTSRKLIADFQTKVREPERSLRVWRLETTSQDIFPETTDLLVAASGVSNGMECVEFAEL